MKCLLLILISILLRASLEAVVVRHVNAAATPGGDGQSQALTNDGDGHRAFSTLREAVEHASLDVVEERYIYCWGNGSGTADTVSVANAHWQSLDSTPASRVYIIGDWVGGVKNTGYYWRHCTNSDNIYNGKPGHVWMYNIWAKNTMTTGTDDVIFRLATENVGIGRTDCDCRFINCFAEGDNSSGGALVGYYDSEYDDAGSGEIYRINCMATGCTIGFGAANANVKNMNCTGFGNNRDFEDPQILINCLGASLSALLNFNSVGTGGGVSDYNASVDTSAPGANKRISQIFTFTNSGSMDFHLAVDDAGARNFGTANPFSLGITSDFEGQTRDGTWDIGADEYQTGGILNATTFNAGNLTVGQ